MSNQCSIFAVAVSAASSSPMPITSTPQIGNTLMTSSQKNFSLSPLSAAHSSTIIQSEQQPLNICGYKLQTRVLLLQIIILHTYRHFIDCSCPY